MYDRISVLIYATTFLSSMIIVDKEDLKRALDWFSSARKAFFESVNMERQG